MKVLHVINSFKYAGAEVLVRNLITGIRKMHSSVCVEVCTPFQKNSWSDDLRKQGIITHDLGLSRRNILGTLIKLKDLIQKEKYDIVHVHLWPSLYYLAIVSKMARHPAYLFTEHNTWNARRKYRMLKFVEAGAYLSYDNIICNSNETKSALLAWVGALRNKIHVVENGVPIPEFQKVSHKLTDPASLIMIGRLVPQKGMDIAIKAVRLLLNKEINVTLTIVGEGPEYTRLKKLAAGLPVRLIGNTPNPYEIMVRSHILIMPSRWEGFGLTAIEALMIGLPIVASRIDALAHIIEDKKTGLLCHCEDASDLSCKIEELIANEELREKLSFNGREIALGNWRIERFIDDTIELYHTILGLGTTTTKTVTKENYRRQHIGQLD